MDEHETYYTRVEYERRFLVSAQGNWRSIVEPYSKRFTDKYICNTRLRLRRLVDSDTGREVMKLNKKYGSTSPYFQPIGRVLLSPSEYALLDKIEGDMLRKTRYYHNHLGQVFSIDVFEGELEGLILCEVEADSLEELMKAEPPEYAMREVTANVFFTGGSLCRATRADLMSMLAS